MTITRQSAIEWVLSHVRIRASADVDQVNNIVNEVWPNHGELTKLSIMAGRTVTSKDLWLMGSIDKGYYYTVPQRLRREIARKV